MANNRNRKRNYCIEQTTYTKRPTGKKNKYGHTEYENVGEPEKTCLNNTNFTDLKKKLFVKSKGKDNVYVAYSKPVFRIRKCRPRIKSVTVRRTDGTKTVTYYNAVKGCKQV